MRLTCHKLGTIIAEENPHAPFEDPHLCAFFYPQRLFVACALSTILVLSLCAVTISLIDYYIVAVENYLATMLAVLNTLGFPTFANTLNELDQALRACLYVALSLMFVLYVVLWVIMFKVYRARVRSMFAAAPDC